MPHAMLEWTPAIAMGVDLLDSQHQELFGIYNRLMSALKTGTALDEIEVALLALQDYVIEHFTEEQELMAELGYPKFEQHEGLHDAFMRDYLTIRKRCSEEGASVQLAEELRQHVGDWLISHIGIADMDFSAFYHAQGSR